MAVSLSPFAGAGWQFFDNNGVILSGGKLYVYAAGTTSSATTYTSVTGLTANTNPIILNSSGRLANEIWLTTGLNYKFILKTSADVLIGTWDNIPAGTTDVADLQAALASSTGAGMIGYTQGSANAVPTTVQAKLRETVSVFDFMTAAQIADVQAGTASIDVTAAIQAALSASSSVYFPSGTYLMNSGVTKLGNNVEINFGNAKFLNNGANFLFTFGSTSNTPIYTGLNIYGGYFEQNNPATTSNLNYIRIAGSSNFSIKSCVLKNVSNGGIYIEAGCENGLIDGVTISGASGYSTCRAIWLIGATASDYADQLIDVSSITRNTTPLPVYAVKNIRITNCSIVLAGYGIYCMNSQYTHIENCYIDISGSGLRCIAINNYSPGAVIQSNTIKGDQSATGILVSQYSSDVIIDGNFFIGSFGGGRDIYVTYLSDCQISNNKFTTNSTQQIQINMGATAVINGNYFTRPSGYSANVRCVYFTTIDPAVAGTETYGNTATTLTGITFSNNVVKYRLSVVNAQALAAQNGNIPGLDVINVRDNILYDFNLATTFDEYGLLVVSSGTTYKIAYSYFNNVMYPAAYANRNKVNTSGAGVTNIRTDVQFGAFRCVTVASATPSDITSTKLYGGYFSCGGATLNPANNTATIVPRTIAGNSGASVATVVEVLDVNGQFASSTIIANGVNYEVKFYNAAGTIIDLTTTAVTFDVVLAGTAT